MFSGNISFCILVDLHCYAILHTTLLWKFWTGQLKGYILISTGCETSHIRYSYQVWVEQGKRVKACIILATQFGICMRGSILAFTFLVFSQVTIVFIHILTPSYFLKWVLDFWSTGPVLPYNSWESISFSSFYMWESVEHFQLLSWYFLFVVICLIVIVLYLVGIFIVIHSSIKNMIKLVHKYMLRLSIFLWRGTGSYLRDLVAQVR